MLESCVADNSDARKFTTLIGDSRFKVVADITSCDVRSNEVIGGFSSNCFERGVSFNLVLRFSFERCLSDFFRDLRGTSFVVARSILTGKLGICDIFRTSLVEGKEGNSSSFCRFSVGTK